MIEYKNLERILNKFRINIEEYINKSGTFDVLMDEENVFFKLGLNKFNYNRLTKEVISYESIYIDEEEFFTHTTLSTPKELENLLLEQTITYIQSDISLSTLEVFKISEGQFECFKELAKKKYDKYKVIIATEDLELEDYDEVEKDTILCKHNNHYKEVKKSKKYIEVLGVDEAISIINNKLLVNAIKEGFSHYNKITSFSEYPSKIRVRKTTTEITDDDKLLTLDKSPELAL